MTASSAHFRSAFRALEHAWVRRAIARVEPVLWLEIGAIALLAGGFLFWRVHIGLASLAHDRGIAAAAGQLALLLGALVLGGAAQAGARHSVRLRASDESPPWLALPIPESALAAHLAAMSRIQARWIAAAAAAILVAAAGVLPATWIALLAVGFLATHELAGHAACALALRFVAATSARRVGLAPIVRVLADAARGGAVRRLPAARWRSMPAGVALWRNDLRLALRVRATRRRAFIAALAIAASFAAWRAPMDPRAAHLLAFALAMFAAATVAEWLIAAIGADPADVLRTLPLGLGAAWGARVAWAALAAIVLVVGHALAARAVEPAALRFFLVCVGFASLVIATLGVNYGVSLYPRAEQAQRVLALSLGLAIAASLMVPLMGWIVLLTALLHSLRRVARWSRAEVR